MNNLFVFQMPESSSEMIHKFKLHNVLSNNRTSIFENDGARFSIDHKVVRVMIFNEKDKILLEEIRNYFYGKEYETL